jgi:predicted AlkP superfamily phosphohydrolase/phosphomutase
MKVLLIGLDGATWDLIEPWANQGHLPTFKMLIEEGVHGDLFSTIPAWTIPAWNAISTGKNPGKLGFTHFASRERGSYKFKPSFLYTEETDIWNILSTMGKTVIVVNPPNLHKASQVNGCMIAGFLYLNKDALTYPKTLKKELDDVVGNYEVDVLDSDFASDMVEERYEFARNVAKKEEDEKYLERIYSVQERRFKAVRYLLKKKWDFAFTVFVATDRAQHRYWADKSVLLDLYKKIDSELETILSIIDDGTAVIMVSDHGFGLRNRVLNINEWLLKEGYMKLKTETSTNWTKTANLLRRYRVLPLVKASLRLVPKRLSMSLGDKVNYIIADDSNIDWSKTMVFTQPSEHVCGELYINMSGREPNGIVDSERYERIRDEIIQKLGNLEDPATGEKVSAKVYKKEELYKGQGLDLAPDLMIQMDEHIGGFNARVGYNQIFINSTEGDHRQNGIFLAWGPNIRKGAKIENVKVYDIAPTILHLFDLPIDRDMDGRVLKEIFAPGSDISNRDIKYKTYATEKARLPEQTRSDETEEQIKNRLRKLGYL